MAAVLAVTVCRKYREIKFEPGTLIYIPYRRRTNYKSKTPFGQARVVDKFLSCHESCGSAARERLLCPVHHHTETAPYCRPELLTQSSDQAPYYG